MPDCAIEVDGLRKAYGAHEAVRGISFRVRRGEVFGLLGPNGAGKTTTVEMLEGYRDPHGGPRVRARPRPRRAAGGAAHAGRDRAAELRHLPAPDRPRAAGALGARCTRGRATSSEVLAVTGLEASADRRTRALSGGQLRRLDFALALVGDPELVFLDEPTTGFDPEARRTAWATVRSLRELGKTVLLTTHYLDEAQALADRVAIIKDGAILAEGAPGDLGPGAARYRVAYRLNGSGPLVRETDDPTTLLHALTADALARGERLTDLSVTRPSLEEVYLELIADAESEAVAGARSGTGAIA